MKYLVAASILSLAALAPAAHAQTTYSENFTGTSTNNSWFFLNGACLTAGTSTSTTATNPACQGLPYYTAKGDTLFGGDTGTLPDTAANGGGALRFTNRGNENGAILSNFNFPLSSSGLAVSFTTVTYEGDSGGSGGDGADGISFFLQNAIYTPDVGAFGGSLGYTCSNTNNDTTLRASTGLQRGYDGLAGGYIGLGIDEYGNFLNSGDNTSTGDTAASGSGQFQPGRIGLRGPGSTLWSYLNATYATQYPSALSTSQRASAVQQACQTGYVWDWSQSSPVAHPELPLKNYTAIPTAFKILPSATQPIANEAATVRSQATPITYNLKITATGLLSFSYSYNGGANQNVISSVDITQGGANPLPTSVRFGFAGSTGGSRNIHEVMCFQATPSITAQSSAGLNQKQTAKVQTGTQVYFAFYNPVTLAGSLTSQYLVQSVSDPTSLSISPTINWDGSCVLTGVPAGTNCDSTGPAGLINPQTSANRTILSFAPSGTASSGSSPGPGSGIPFQWANLTGTQKAALDSGDPTPLTLPTAAYRLNYLRGDRTQEQVPNTATTFTGLYRDRASVLGDIIDSSPTWVGPPNATFPTTWVDSLHSTGDTMSENSGQSYTTFSASGTSTYTSGTAANNKEQQRTNVVYAGANDGMLHGFRSGSFSSTNTFVATNNDGHEVLAYVPAYVVSNIQNATDTTLNYSDPQYGHRFDVDAPPGTGDLFYNGLWHTWLIGGLGAGGKAIYALDITDPDSMFTEGNATGSTGVVKGEWSTITSTTTTTTAGVTTTTQSLVSTTMNCLNDTSTPCGNSLGNTYGIPQIRRFHNGSWGAVFGNGLGSVSGDAGIFVMLVNPSSSTGAVTFYYLSTARGSASNPNGIAYVTPADLDGDHITDYVYAGDLLGNVWRFDLTSTTPSAWQATSTPVFSTGPNLTAAGANATTPASNQPITTKVSVISMSGTGSANPRVLIEFGTGQQLPLTNSSGATYTLGTQALYGIWDWNMSAWNAMPSNQKYATLASHGAVAGYTTLQQQSILTTVAAPGTAAAAGTGTDYRTVTSAPVCYADITGCSQFGWYMTLASGNVSNDPAVPDSIDSTYATNPLVYEQVIFSPVVEAGAFLVNTTIPPSSAPTMCFSSQASGWTMALNPATGGSFTNAFFGDANGNFLTTGIGTSAVAVSGVALGGTGSPSLVQSGTQSYVITQTVSGVGALIRNFPQGNTQGKRLTWIQKR
jgi:type IV pilus assembly protein PilY1